MFDILEEVNLCDEIIKEAKRINLSESCIKVIETNEIYRNVYNKSPIVQRKLLTVLLFKILMSAKFIPPAEIRLSLNSANDLISWLTDIKLTILPFIKANEDHYFPNLS